MAFDNFKLANYPLALLSPELYARHLSRLFTGDVIDGLTVIPGTGLQVTLQAGTAFVRYGAAKVASARLVSLVDDYNLAIGTPDGSNPRIDLVVLYIDNGVSLPSGTPTSANLDGPGVAKALIVPGTPNATPVAPNSTAIQAAVGSSNPYTVLYQVYVDHAPLTLIASNKITDVRSIAQVTASRVNFGGAGSGIWWEEIGRLKLNAAGNSISISNLPVRKYLHVEMSVLQSGTTAEYIRFNGDAATNYSWARSINNGTVTQFGPADNFDLVGDTNQRSLTTLDIANVAGSSKLCRAYRGVSSGTSSNPPNWVDLTGFWSGTTQISQISYSTATGNFAIGSEMIILGHD